MYIYVICADANDRPIKIGISAAVQERLRALQTSHPTKLTVKWSLRVRNALAIERRARAALSESRMLGEWFDISADEAISTLNEIVRIDTHEPLPEENKGRVILEFRRRKALEKLADKLLDARLEKNHKRKIRLYRHTLAAAARALHFHGGIPVRDIAALIDEPLYSVTPWFADRDHA